MRDFLTMYLAVVRGRLSLDSFFESRGKFKTAVAAFFAAIFVLAFFVTFLWLFVPLARAASDMEYPALAMELAVLGAGIPCFAFAFFGVIRNVCNAGDILLLAHLPVRRVCIFRTKTAYVYTLCLLSSSMTFLPALAVYSYFSGGDIILWLRGIAAALLLPSVPMAAGAVLAALVSLIPGSGKSLSTVAKYGSALVIPVTDAVLAVLCIMSGDNAEKVGQFLTANWAALKSLSIPPFSWAALSVCNGGLTSVITSLLFCASVLFCWLVSLWVLRAMFVRRVSRVLSVPADKAMR